MADTEIFSLNNPGLFDLLICRVKDNVSCEFEGETIILGISSGIYSKLDAVGTFIWDQLEKPVSMGVLCDELLAGYDVDREQCLRDLLCHLKELDDNKLISVSFGEMT